MQAKRVSILSYFLTPQQTPNKKSTKKTRRKETKTAGKNAHFITKCWCFEFLLSNLSLTPHPSTKIMTGNLQFAPFQHGMLQKFMPCMVQAQFPRLNSAVLGISQARQAIHHEALTPNGQAPYSEQTNKQTNKQIHGVSQQKSLVDFSFGGSKKCGDRLIWAVNKHLQRTMEILVKLTKIPMSWVMSFFRSPMEYFNLMAQPQPDPMVFYFEGLNVLESGIVSILLLRFVVVLVRKNEANIFPKCWWVIFLLSQQS